MQVENTDIFFTIQYASHFTLLCRYSSLVPYAFCSLPGAATHGGNNVALKQGSISEAGGMGWSIRNAHRSTVVQSVALSHHS